MADVGMFADPSKTSIAESDDDESDYSGSEEEDEDDLSDPGGFDRPNFSEPSPQPPQGHHGQMGHPGHPGNPGHQGQRPAFAAPSGMSAKARLAKKELLMRLEDAVRSGYVATDRYDMDSPLEDLEAEVTLYDQKVSHQALVDMLQDGIMTAIKLLEFANSRWDPIGCKMDGITEALYGRRTQLERAYGRLATKYSGGRELPPELSILFIIGGTILMTHISNTMMKPGGIDLVGMMSSFKDLVGQPPARAAPQQSQQSQPQAQHQPQAPRAAQPTIKPSVSLDALLSQMHKPAESKPDTRSELPYKKLDIPAPRALPQIAQKHIPGDKNAAIRHPVPRQPVKQPARPAAEQDRFEMMSDSDDSGSVASSRASSRATKTVISLEDD